MERKGLNTGRIVPRDQASDRMVWDDGSHPNSPTSVRTPDGDSFEVEMLDSDLRNFQQAERPKTFRYYDQVAVLMIRWADESDGLKTGPEVGHPLGPTSVGSVAEL
jgi:hypothetical protein